MWLNNSDKRIEQVVKKDTKSLILEAQTLFTEQKIDENIDFFNSLTNSDIFDNFRKFLNKKERFKELSLNISWYNSDQKDSLAEQILEEKAKILFVRKKNIADLVQIFNREYDNLDQAKITNEILKISTLDVIKFLKSGNKRKQFLLDKWFFADEKSLLKDKKSDEKNIIDNIWISKTSFNKLKKEEKERLYELFNNYKKLTFSELENFLTILSDKKSKENLLKYFISTVSISDLEKYGILDSKIKNSLIESIKNTLGVSEKEAKNIFLSIDKDKIFVNISELWKFDLSSLIENKSLQKEILDEYNAEIAESWLDDNIQSSLKLDNKWNIHNSFLNFVKYSDEVSPEIKNQIDLLKKWNYFEINSWNKKWVYFIKSIDNWWTLSSKSMIFENITDVTGVKKLWDWKDEQFWYESFYKLLEKISSSENQEKLSMKFYEKDEFKKAWFFEKITNKQEIESYEDLLKLLDSIDPEWKKFWFDENKTVITKQDEKNGDFVFLIKNIDKLRKTIYIDQWWKFWTKKISFKDFYKIMSQNSSKMKRSKKINNFSDLNISLWGVKWFENLELKNWKIVNTNDKSQNAITSFVWSNGKWIVIKSISDNDIKYVIWDIEEKNGKKIIKNWLLSSNFSQFAQDIKSFSFSPDTKNFLENTKQLDRKTSFVTKFLSGLSISDIINSWEFIINSIKKKLERWNRLKSLMFATKFWWLLWKSMSSTLKSMKESEEKSLIDEIKWNLQTLDSGPMMEQVMLILKNKNSEIYEIVAALMAVSKYWNIYPKSPLKEYAWSFLWYKALGGTDSFKAKAEKEIKAEGRNFTEEELIQRWMKSNPNLFRSKLWKDFAKELWSGEAWEMESWAKDASDKQNAKWALWHFVWLLAWREYAWALWAADSTFWKNGSSEQMQAVGFILSMSWYGKYFDQVLVRKVNALAFTTPYSSIFYATSEAKHIAYKNFIKALIKNSPKFKWRESKVLAELENIYKKWDTVNNVYAFWQKYWVDLVDYINFKDPFIALNADKIPEFAEFLWNAKWIWTDNEFSPKKEDVDTWVYTKNSVAIVWNAWNLWMISWNAVWWFSSWTSIATFDMYIDTFKSIKNSQWTIEQKQKLFKEVFMPFERHIAEIHWYSIETVNSTKNPIYAALVKNWLDLVKTQTKPQDYDEQIEKIFNNFMYFEESTKEKIQEDTTLAINDIIN